ncbi:MAG: hypothetical protein H6727_19820 [Myxococcales bacterium]|nr:hypothetical protein [Myxococcales bacterium]
MRHKAARPSKARFSIPINGPVVIFSLILAIGGYLVYAYVPPWTKSLSAKSKIKEMLSELSMEDVDEEKLAESITREMRELGLDLGEAIVQVEADRDSRTVRVYFDWKTEISFPFLEAKHKVTYGFDIQRKMR